MTTTLCAVPAKSIAFREPRGGWRTFDIAAPGCADSDEPRSDDPARSGLHDMLLGSLQMQNVVVLAGSGCSYSAGGPTMTDLQVKSHTAATVFLSNAKAQILERCRKFLISPNEPDLDAHTTFLRRLSRRRARDPRLKIFTTNYDLCFEFAAGQIGAVALDGFSFTNPRRYDPRYFSYDIIRRPQGTDDLGRFVAGVFLLHKLHGSVNWARVVDQGGQHESVEQRERVEPDHACLIYPAQGKYQQSFTQPHLESIAQYLAAIREPNTCLLVVGFGFNDNHLSAPLLNAARSNPHLRIIVVDPEAQNKTEGEGPCRQLADLGARGEDIWFIAAKFVDFASLIPDLKALTPAERLARDITDLSRASR